MGDSAGWAETCSSCLLAAVSRSSHVFSFVLLTGTDSHGDTHTQVAEPRVSLLGPGVWGKGRGTEGPCVQLNIGSFLCHGGRWTVRVRDGRCPRSACLPVTDGVSRVAGTQLHSLGVGLSLGTPQSHVTMSLLRAGKLNVFRELIELGFY